MKFKFKSLSSFEEKSLPNFTGENNGSSIIKEFNSMDEAIRHVAENHGFVKTEDELHSFVVRSISEVKWSYIKSKVVRIF